MDISWHQFCTDVEEALADTDVHFGMEAALCEGCISSYSHKSLDGYEKQLWCRFTAMRFLQDEEVKLYVATGQ